MSEMTILAFLGWASVTALALPVIAVAYTVWKEASSTSFVILDEGGRVLGEISADIVQHNPTELVEMHKRVRQSGNVTFRAAA